MESNGAYLLTQKKQVDKTIEAIVSLIKDNHLVSGDKLPSERQIAEQLCLSRTSVREGLCQLNSVGLLKSVQGKGIILNEITVNGFFECFRHSDINFFLKLDPKDVKDLGELRILIESYSAQMFLENCSPPSLNAMRQTFDEMQKFYFMNDSFQYLKLDLLFHKQLVALSCNMFLENIYAMLRSPSIREVELLFAKDNILKIHNYHRQILNNLENKNPKVVQTIQEHLQYLLEIDSDLKN